MADRLFLVANGPAPTTAAVAPTATGTAIKTHLQIATSTSEPIDVVEWGISFDGSAAATPIRVELLATTVAATVTAHAAAGIMSFNDPAIPASSLQLGAALTGYNATVEGTPANVRIGDVQFVAPTGQYVKQYPLGREFRIPASGFLRIRTTSAASVNCYCYVIYNE